MMQLYSWLVLASVVLFRITDIVYGDCATAPSITGAFHNGSTTGSYSEGVVLRYMCGQAYDRILGGSNYYRCSNGVWTGGNLRCTLGSCTAIEPPPNSYITGKAGYYVGETTTLSCQDGYEMNGNGVITCMADRTWSPTLPMCVMVMCPEFYTPKAEIFQEPKGVRNGFESKNKITCLDGTVLQGPQYITCLANKTWSGTPRCIRPNCGNPRASYEPCTEVFYTDGNTNVGSQVEVTCLGNAVEVGESNILICQSSGRWNSEYHCLCGCTNDCDGSVNTGLKNVMHNTDIECPCPDGSHFKRKCSNGTLETVSYCRVVHSTVLFSVNPTTPTHYTDPNNVTNPTLPQPNCWTVQNIAYIILAVVIVILIVIIIIIIIREIIDRIIKKSLEMVITSGYNANYQDKQCSDSITQGKSETFPLLPV